MLLRLRLRLLRYKLRFQLFGLGLGLALGISPASVLGLSLNVFSLPDRLTLGYLVSTLNLFGSLLFAVASLFYFAQVPPYDGLTAGGLWGWEWQASEWGVRFTFAIGSAAFVVAALLNISEILND